MSFVKFNILSGKSLQSLTLTWQRWYAAKPSPVKTSPAALGKKMAGKGGKLGAVVEKKIMPVETDPKKLVSFVCGANYYVKGPEIKLKPDSEYPDWLWNLHTGPPKKLSELDPETKQYWRKLRQEALRRNNQLQKIKKF